MTAVAGYWSFDGRLAGQQCARILEGQSLYGGHRAQDDDGVLALGRNLFVTLPEDVYDRGPISRRAFRLVADVRLDNREELITRLGDSRQENQRASDAELLFQSLLKWGEDATDHLVGEYAFAFWDGNRRELLLGRDFLGLRPLHYHSGKGYFAFASMPSGLHALEDVPYALDTDFMVQSLALVPPAGGQSHFRDIMRVEPGSLVRVTAGGIRQHKYWNPNPQIVENPKVDDFAEGLRALFDDVVKAQLRGSGAIVATHLSSGLDSSAVTATVARQHAPGEVVAFTAVPRVGFDGQPPPGTMANEGELAATTARCYSNVRHVLVESTGTSPIACLDRSFPYQQQPITNIANASWGEAIQRQASERGAKLIFKGGLGNITASYAGMESLPWLLSQRRFRDTLDHAGALIRNGTSLSSLASTMFGPFVPVPLWQALRRVTGRAAGLKSYSAVNQHRLSALADARQKEAIAQAERPLVDPLKGRLAALSHGDGGGNAYKGVLAQWGLSIREPAADRRIVEYCLAVPIEEFVRGGMPRSLARRAFSDRLPSVVTQNQVRGCQASDWYEAVDRARPEIEDEIDAFLRCDEAREVLDPGWFREAMEAWPAGDWNSSTSYHRYRIGLLRGVSAGHFMRKVAGTN